MSKLVHSAFLALIVSLASLAACGDDDVSRVEIDVSEAAPGLPERLDALELTVSVLGGDGSEEIVRTRRIDARYDTNGLVPWRSREAPRAAADVGARLYRFRVVGTRTGMPYVAAQQRLVFVPGRTVVLPVRLHASCVGRSCRADETCDEQGCRDDFVPACTLLSGSLSSFCTEGRDRPDGAVLDAQVEDAAFDATAGSSMDGDIDGSRDARGADAIPDGPIGGEGSDAGSCIGDSCRPVAIAAGFDHACVVLVRGEVLCWGRNNEGQLGFPPRFERVPVPGSPPVAGAAHVAAGALHSCAATRADVECWGMDGSGELGNGPALGTGMTPVTVTGLAEVAGLTAGGSHTCAWTSAGAAYCWGANSRGQVGDGTTLPRDAPVAVMSLPFVEQVSAGNMHTCALSAGTVYCWGDNTLGMLGDGHTAPSPLPLAVGTTTSYVEVAAGGRYTCARLADGTVDCWGYSGIGSVPSRVEGLADARVLAAGSGHDCAVDSAGDVYCWGENGYGQLGDGTITRSLTPVAVDTSATGPIVGIAAGTFFTCAIDALGRVWCWGRNNFGQLGDGTLDERHTPAHVEGLPGG